MQTGQGPVSFTCLGVNAAISLSFVEISFGIDRPRGKL